MMSGMPRPASNSRRTVWPGAFGATRITSTSVGGLDVAEADVEAVREGQGLAGGQLGLDVVGVDRALVLVGRQDHDEVGHSAGVGDVVDREALVLGLGDGLGAFLQADDDLNAGVAQVQRVGVALASRSR